jgi:RNA polymerase sigma factor (sigma-70 family)
MEMTETTDKCYQMYDSIIKDHPILTREEELSLSNAINKFKSGKLHKDARDKLFCSNIRLVLNEAKKYRFNNLDYEDMVSAGFEGLIIAIDRFNPKKFKTKLSTYAIHWIHLKITRFINENINPVYVPENVIQKSREYNRKDCEDLSEKDLMKELNLSKSALKNVRMSNIKSVSMDKELTNSDNEADPNNTLRNVIASSEPTSDELCLSNDNKCNVMAALSELTPVQQDILTSRYLGGEKENLKDIGKRHGLTGERVRQIEFKALKQMRKNLKKMFNFTK